MRSLAGLAWQGAASLAVPVLRLSLRRRLARGKEIEARLPERRGLEAESRPPGRLLWLHAASVGETVSLLPLLEALAREAPDASLLLTTGTVTSARLVAELLPARGLDARVRHRFVPLDVPHWVGRFLDHWRPDLACFVESEIWPNLLRACARRGIPRALVNARLSPRSAAAWRRAPGLARELLDGMRVAARSEQDRERLLGLGAREVVVLGDLKFAAPPLAADAAALADLSRQLGERPRWLAASTHPGEEAIVAEAHGRLLTAFPGLVTIIAPRHPERGAALARTLGAPRRADGPPEGGIWIADSLGELGLLFRLAPIVLVGFSLLPGGEGHNPLEPARLGCAIAVGAHPGNHAEACDALREAGALATVTDATSLADWVGALLRDEATRTALGRRARAVATGADDLPDRLALWLLRPLPSATPGP